MTRTCTRIALLLLTMTVALGTAFAANTTFRAAAARIDVTPPQQKLPQPYLSVFEHIYARVIVIDNGASRLVLASVG